MVTAQLNAVASLEFFVIGAPPYRTRGGGIILDGPAVFRSADGHQETLDFDHLDSDITFDDFRSEPTCDPGIMHFRLNWHIGVTGSDASVSVSNDVAVRGLGLVVHRSADTPTIELNGQIDAGCLGGWVTITTVTPLTLPLGSSCFTGGVLTLESPRLHLGIEFGADQSV